MNTISSLRTQDDIIDVEYEVISPIDISRNAEREVIKQSILDLDDRMAKNQALIDELNVDIDKRKISVADIKNFGSYTAEIKLYPNISATITVEVGE